MMSESHISEEELLVAARLPGRLSEGALAHLSDCSRCQQHLNLLQAGVEAALLDLLEPLPDGQDPEEAVVNWLTGTKLPGPFLQKCIEHPAGKLLAQRVALDLQLLGVQGLEPVLSSAGIVLPDPEASALGLRSIQGPIVPPITGDVSWWKRLWAGWLGGLSEPGWGGMALASVLLLVSLGGLLRWQQSTPQETEGLAVRGELSTILRLEVEATGYRAAPDGLWDNVFSGLGNSEVACLPGDRLQLLVSGEGSGMLSTWQRIDGGRLEGPMLQQQQTLNTARLKLLPKGEPADALGLVLPPFQQKLEIWVLFSAEPLPDWFREKWAEKQLSGGNGSSHGVKLTCVRR